MTASTVREVRILKGEIRSENAAGKPYLVGYAANYNVLSCDLGGWRERIMPGAFTRAIRERQDIRYLINHDPNQVLGRTAAGTLELGEDSKGLRFRCLIPGTTFARDLVESVQRGDVNACSFAFHCIADLWTSGPDGEGGETSIREVRDVDLSDISTVAYPAYPGTNTAVDIRSMFDGTPAEVRSHINRLVKQARSVDMQRRTREDRIKELLDEIELTEARAILSRL